MPEGEKTDARELVVHLWSAIDAHDWEGLADLLSENFRCAFPQSGEIFSKEKYLRLNYEYPGDWRVIPSRIFVDTPWVISEVDVEIDGRVDRAVSFFRVEEGRITELREYWPDPFGVPEWRKNW